MLTVCVVSFLGVVAAALSLVGLFFVHILTHCGHNHYRGSQQTFTTRGRYEQSTYGMTEWGHKCTKKHHHSMLLWNKMIVPLHYYSLSLSLPNTHRQMCAYSMRCTLPFFWSKASTCHAHFKRGEERLGMKLWHSIEQCCKNNYIELVFNWIPIHHVRVSMSLVLYSLCVLVVKSLGGSHQWQCDRPGTLVKREGGR